MNAAQKHQKSKVDSFSKSFIESLFRARDNSRHLRMQSRRKSEGWPRYGFSHPVFALFHPQEIIDKKILMCQRKTNGEFAV